MGGRGLVVTRRMDTSPCMAARVTVGMDACRSRWSSTSVPVRVMASARVSIGVSFVGSGSEREGPAVPRSRDGCARFEKSHPPWVSWPAVVAAPGVTAGRATSGPVSACGSGGHAVLLMTVAQWGWRRPPVPRRGTKRRTEVRLTPVEAARHAAVEHEHF